MCVCVCVSVSVCVCVMYTIWFDFMAYQQL